MITKKLLIKALESEGFRQEKYSPKLRNVEYFKWYESGCNSININKLAKLVRKIKKMENRFIINEEKQ